MICPKDKQPCTGLANQACKTDCLHDLVGNKAPRGYWDTAINHSKAQEIVSFVLRSLEMGGSVVPDPQACVTLALAYHDTYNTQIASYPGKTDTILEVTLPHITQEKFFGSWHDSSHDGGIKSDNAQIAQGSMESDESHDAPSASIESTKGFLNRSLTNPLSQRIPRGGMSSRAYALKKCRICKGEQKFDVCYICIPPAETLTTEGLSRGIPLGYIADREGQ